MSKKVMVSGCFDLLHSGHVAFFQEAAQFGDLYVALGSDRTVYELKGTPPVNSQDERLFMVKAIRCVKDAFISRGSGVLDFAPEFEELKPDIFVVNEDGHSAEKQRFVESHGAEYVVLKRKPYADLTPRSTTALRSKIRIPFRIDLAGGWLDQPYVSKHYPGAVVTISIEPTLDFNERSGMATSTRNAAIELWGPRLPADKPERLAKIVFAYENPPGKQEISGSQDAIGIVFPGLAYSYYNGGYWPERIEHVMDGETLTFVEQSLQLVAIGPREDNFNVLSDTIFDRERAKALADAADDLWEATLAHDFARFGAAMRRSYEAQIAMFPRMVTPQVAALIDQHRDHALGWKLCGAGGGGYLVLVTEQEIPGAVRVVARRTAE